MRVASHFFPQIKRYPIAMPPTKQIFLVADLSNNVFFPLLKYGAYPHQVTEDLIISTFLRTGACVLDVGANIGYVSAICAEYVGEKGMVYSFEPSKVTFNYLKQLSSKISQIKPQQFAILDKCGSIHFIDEKLSDRSHISIDRKNKSYEVNMTTIDFFVDNNLNKVDFIKIDAEGFDLDVIKGSLKTINTYSPIIEFESESRKDFEDIYNLLNKSVNNNNYNFYRVCNQYPTSLITNSKFTNNYFAFSKQRDSFFPIFLFEREFLVPWEPGS